MLLKPLWYLGACSLLVLTACGSSDDDDDQQSSSSSSMMSSSSSEASSVSSTSSSSSSVSLTEVSGLAAVGAPVANATVTAKCADGSTFTSAVTTSAQGSFTGNVTTGALPCALQVSGGDPAVVLHSYTATGGRVNITPLTDLIIANASNSLPGEWFVEPEWDAIADYLDVSTAEIKTALTDAGFTLPAGDFMPFSQTFVIGDAWDQLLDNLQLAIDASASLSNYAALVNLISQGSLSVIPSPAVSSSSSSSSVASSASSVSSSSSSSSSVSSGGSGGSASVCYNAELNAEGTQIISNYKATDGDTSEVINFSYDQTVYGETTFKGQTTRYAVSDTIATGVSPSRSTSTAYFSNDDSAYRTTTHGTEVVTTQPISSTTVNSNQPGRLTRYDLDQGESYSQTYTNTTQTMGFNIDTSISFTTTFAGIESITVPAGTYQACRFNTTEGGVDTSRWIAVDQGIELRVLSDGDDTVFVSGTVNGVAQ